MTTPSPKPHACRHSLKLWADQPVAHPSPMRRALHFLVRLILITITEFNHNILSLRTRVITYTVLLSFVPILAMSTAVVKGLGGGDQLRKAAHIYIESLDIKAI